MHLNPASKMSGFSLVELIVAVSILVIISAASIPNFSTFIKSQNLTQAQESIKSGIRDAQNRAITGEESNTPLCNSSNCTHWVIKFINNGTTYQLGKTNGNAITDCSNNLDTSDYISDVFPGDVRINLGTSSYACIFYEFLTADESDINLTGDTVKVFHGNDSKCVLVNSSGLVMGAACP